MVQFVKPNLLGKYNEYLNRFVNPITNGQYHDSSPFDIQMMKRRSHILHKLLDGCVQRRDYAVLAPFLPPKHEYVLSIRLTPLQKQLYKVSHRNLPQSPAKQTTDCESSFSFISKIDRSMIMKKAKPDRRGYSKISRTCSVFGHIRWLCDTTAIGSKRPSKREETPSATMMKVH